uniref:S-phase kinase associated protein 2 n=1 Tax=Pundamilia nyererei TaxID=303518 RepID=A0A3B4H9U5_9CICH
RIFLSSFVGASVNLPVSLCPKKSKSRGILSEGLDTECTPTDFILQFTPPRKQQRLFSKGKENDSNQFVLSRRSRRKDSSPNISWDQLPDEVVLRIFFCLPLQDLVRISVVCKRWQRLAFDESLWHSVDLEGMTHTALALQQVLRTGIRRLRCPQKCSFLSFPLYSSLQVVQMDLSSSIIPTLALEDIICRCRLLECLSLEGLQLSDTIISCLAKNTRLQELNLSGCSAFSAPVLTRMLKSCSRIQQLNLSWCTFDNNHIKSVVDNLSSSVTHLNLSGYRESLTLNGDDSTLLTADCLPVLSQLKHLLHLSLSRCYHIHLAALTDVGIMFPVLSQLDVFGLVQDSQLPSLKREMPHVSINSRPFSSIARPTPASRFVGSTSDRTMWNKKCRLTQKHL